MKLNVGAFAVASGTVAAAASAICAFFVAVAPGATKAFFSMMFHIDLSSLPYILSWGSFIGGLVCWFATVAIVFGAGAWLYNRFASETPGQ